MKRIVLLAFVLWLLSTAVAITFVSPVVAQGTIYIRSDGSVDPPSAPIQRDGNVYTFTDNIYDEIVVQRDNIVVDGASHILQGTGSGTGIYLSSRSNVAIQNMQIRHFDNGIYLRRSSGNNIHGNAITNNEWGIYLYHSSGNNIYRNAITNNQVGIYFYRSSNNVFYHNSFIDNTDQVSVPDTYTNVWDDGYPSGGNYWSDYTGVDNLSGPDQNETGSDGIGDTEYLIALNNRDRYPLMSDLVPPLISIISPENKTYAIADVTLVFTVSEAVSWMGYSLDGQATTTITGNTTLTSLFDGPHHIVVYANDTAGNMGTSNTIYFTVDTVAPNIELLSPQNKTYTTDSVSLSFTVDEETSWMGYSLDSQTNNTITGNITLVGLSDGTHTITVYATDTAGNTGHSNTIYFTVDTTLPNITILSPENKTYAENDVQLSFTVDEAVSWMGYSLDGQATTTITGNTTLTSLFDGPHHIVVYANDTAGNMGTSNTIYFTVDTVAPNIELLSPQNKTYTTDSVSLSFTVDEETSWMGYSLDSQTNNTITGDTTLTALSDGTHSLVIYASDMLGNTGSSDKIYFTVDTTLPSITILSPENRTYDTTVVPLSFTVDEAVSWMGYSLDGQATTTITGNTNLILLNGLHYVVVYATDTAGNMGTSNTIYFTVDTEAPYILLVSPTNTTYASTSVPLRFVLYDPTSWMGYSLDGQTNETVGGNTTLVDLSEGIHTITVYAADTAGNMGHSNTVYFAVDTTLPNIIILSPENKTYAENDVQLSFTVDKAVSWLGYSLDGQANVTITGNVNLTLPDGVHYVVVYANNTAGKMAESDPVYFTVDTEAPIIKILSPKNETYASTSFSLDFTRSEPTSWMSYSLDGQTNETVSGNTTLSGLSEGIHSITVYANDTGGNMGSSEIVYFTVDTVAPRIELLSPQNKTYATDSVSLSFTVDEETSWMGYSLDGQTNITITGDTTLTALSDGTHSLVVYASDIVGNTGSSDKIYFTIETVLPIIELLAPENKTYAVADVPLSFTVSEATAWMGYSLDSQMNETISGNITLFGLSDDVHTITVYANDTGGNMGHSVAVYFTINALPPNIEVFSPGNKTYATDSVSLSFDVNEPTLWRGYSLDGQANVTIFGDITLTGLSEGSHSLIVYARDMAGNIGASGIVYFAVETRQTAPSQLWIVAVIALVAGVGFALTGYMAYDLFKRAQK